MINKEQQEKKEEQTGETKNQIRIKLKERKGEKQNGKKLDGVRSRRSNHG